MSRSAAEPETIVCDTSFVGVQERAGGARPNWPQAVVDRLDAAVLAISVISLAEVRAGRIYANWGRERSDRQEARLAAFLRLPLDEAILDMYTDIHAWSLHGNAIPHHDMWIAATAISRGFALVSCDQDFDRIAGPFPLEHIYLPAN